jgi:anti-sigma factor RsiW
MNDDDALWIAAALDGELDAAASLALDRRLASEPALKAAWDEQRALRDVVRERATRHAAPEALRARFAAAPRIRAPRPWLYAGGGALVASMATVVATLAIVDRSALRWPGGAPSEARRLASSDTAAEAVSAHTRALLVDHPIEVASSDQHTVRPWLSARLNFVPPVVDLAPQGFALLGARRDVLAGDTAAALVYRHGAHVISVFVRPMAAAEASSASTTSVVRGFNVLQRTHAGMAFCLVSDVNPHDLVTLADLLTRD